MRELGLSVFPSVLVAEASSELVVAVRGAGADEQLFRLLRGLWQGIEKGSMYAAVGRSGRSKPRGHEKLAGAFWSRLEQDRRLHFQEV